MEREHDRDQAGGTGGKQQQPGGIAGLVLAGLQVLGAGRVGTQDDRPHATEERESGGVPSSERGHLPPDDERQQHPGGKAHAPGGDQPPEVGRVPAQPPVVHRRRRHGHGPVIYRLRSRPSSHTRASSGKPRRLGGRRWERRSPTRSARTPVQAGSSQPGWPASAGRHPGRNEMASTPASASRPACPSISATACWRPPRGSVAGGRTRLCEIDERKTSSLAMSTRIDPTSSNLT